MHATTRLLLAATAIAVSSLPARASSIDLVSPNLLCDRAKEICYDAQGPSLNQTRRTYGERAERNLLRQLSGRPPVTTFTLSNGTLCDLRARTCWEDGNRRSNVNNRYTQHLFSGAGPVGSRTCQLIQRGRRIFQGSCSLSRRTMAGGTAYVVETQDGRRYTFYNEGTGRLVLRDATGVWPVNTGNVGNQASFRWADVQLLASRPAGTWGAGQGGYGSDSPYGPPYGQGYNQGVPEPRGGLSTPAQALDTLLNSLFR
ncbi:hypothetical protein [Synechococcus sp. CBW1004]|uniref:YcgJ family protein n=1 Tax=Synechococcus sp. CBW1004 TaxID=1353136 RepID=UPI0018CD58C6|nr:hypothetical protein [Synechococcus sp. CBW1004]QPN64366.1 hypothetical protein H8F25_06335 [Synechococcus sp. CBW1004]